MNPNPHAPAMPADLYRRRRWYALGATCPLDLPAYSSAENNEARRAYAAGLIARAFGVDLTPV